MKSAPWNCVSGIHTENIDPAGMMHDYDDEGMDPAGQNVDLTYDGPGNAATTSAGARPDSATLQDDAIAPSRAIGDSSEAILGRARPRARGGVSREQAANKRKSLAGMFHGLDW